MYKTNIESLRQYNAAELKRKFDNIQDLIDAWRRRYDEIKPFVEDPEYGKLYLAELQSYIDNCLEEQAEIILLMQGKI